AESIVTRWSLAAIVVLWSSVARAQDEQCTERISITECNRTFTCQWIEDSCRRRGESDDKTVRCSRVTDEEICKLNDKCAWIEALFDANSKMKRKAYCRTRPVTVKTSQIPG